MAVVAVDRVDGSDGALLIAGAVGSLVSQCWETRSPQMHAPERWPFGDIESWWHGVTTSTVSRIPTSRH